VRTCVQNSSGSETDKVRGYSKDIAEYSSSTKDEIILQPTEKLAVSQAWLYIYILWSEVVSDGFTALLNKCLSGRIAQRSSEIQFQNMSFVYICSLKYYSTNMTLRHAILKIR
jgi:hypothetical protein